ncbi:hypothetical protein EXE42_00905 [Halorubrum sp. SP3]|uniref:hypothetical protein n=1 Tax=Halorubrum sp. SP3 TaxID=1537265 RepID=UPI00113C7A60|nr:hypothetical protein [Halorubrum sp. SP3]TKX56149.1 hypothetical protein EXE42_00905 [Halorubrum sp. SP3]
MRFNRDRRGQSVVVGTVVLFGFLILALSLYQVQIVPQENAEVEFQHFEEVRNDLVELRNGILSAGSSERPQFVDVKLGTRYQTRVFTVNPPDPVGTLRTSDAYNITITDDSGTKVNISTRFIEYRPGYNELESGSMWYDNSVLYLAESNSNRPAVVIEDQNILVDNDTLRLTAVQNEFSASGTRKVAVELYPTSDATDLSNLSGTIDVRIPTRLGSEDGYWNESIENGSVTYQGVNDSAYPTSSEVSALLLQVDSPDNVTVNSVGIQSEPSGETVKDNVGPVTGGGAGAGGGNGGDTSPGGDPELKYVTGTGTDTDDNGRIAFELENTGSGDVTITGIRVDSTTDEQADRVNNDGNSEFNGAGGDLNLPSGQALLIGAAGITDLDTNAVVAQGSTEKFNLQQFSRSPGNSGKIKSRDMSGDNVTITLRLDDGTTTTITIENIS